MKVFISWSGERSEKAALALKKWLPEVIQSIEPWVSSSDIDAGSRWSHDISQSLEDSDFGIICLTKQNAESVWINFEAGALSKAVVKSKVCPYLLDLENHEIPQGPLNLFHAKLPNEQETFELIRSINDAMSAGNLDQERLHSAFKRCWPDLESGLDFLSDSESTPSIENPEEESIHEILETVRSISRKLDKDLTNHSFTEGILGSPRNITEGVLRSFGALGILNENPYNSIQEGAGMDFGTYDRLLTQALKLKLESAGVNPLPTGTAGLLAAAQKIEAGAGLNSLKSDEQGMLGLSKCEVQEKSKEAVSSRKDAATEKSKV